MVESPRIKRIREERERQADIESAIRILEVGGLVIAGILLLYSIGIL